MHTPLRRPVLDGPTSEMLEVLSCPSVLGFWLSQQRKTGLHPLLLSAGGKGHWAGQRRTLSYQLSRPGKILGATASQSHLSFLWGGWGSVICGRSAAQKCRLKQLPVIHWILPLGRVEPFRVKCDGCRGLDFLLHQHGSIVGSASICIQTDLSRRGWILKHDGVWKSLFCLKKKFDAPQNQQSLFHQVRQRLEH